MTEYLEIKAKGRIDKIICESNLSYDILMTNLKYKVQDWNSEVDSLERINPYELSYAQCDRKRYLYHMISYSNKLIREYNSMDSATLDALERDRKINKILL